MRRWSGLALRIFAGTICVTLGELACTERYAAVCLAGDGWVGECGDGAALCSLGSDHLAPYAARLRGVGAGVPEGDSENLWHVYGTVPKRKGLASPLSP